MQRSFRSSSARSDSTAGFGSPGIFAAENDCHWSIDPNIVVGLRRPDANERNDLVTTPGQLRWWLSLGSCAEFLISR